MSTITSLPTANSIDPVNDYLAIDTANITTTQKINRNTLLGLSSAPVGLTDSQTLTNKIFTSPTISGPTFSGTLIGTYTIGGTPTFPSSVVTLTGSQTLTNKILTSPTVNAPNITNATISADTLSGFSASTTGTVYGMSVVAGVLASAALANTVNAAALQSSAVTTAKINNAAVTADKLGTGASSNVITTTETTTSASFADLATPGPAVTVTIGANGLALVIISTALSNNTNGDYAVMGFVASGANTIAASVVRSIFTKEVTASVGDRQMSWAYLATGLSAGSTVFTAKYEIITGGTATFSNRYIAVIPL